MPEEIIKLVPTSETELQDKSEDGDGEKKPQQGLFWLISIGFNSAQLILLNFFQYFVAAIVREGLLGFLTAVRNLISALFQGNIGHSSDKRGRRLFLLIGFFLSFAATTLLIFSYLHQAMLIVVAIVHAFSFSIIIPVWNSTLGDITENKGRTTYMGKLSSVGQGVGVVLMLVLAGVFFSLEEFKGIVLDFEIQYGIIFGVVAANLLICAIGVMFLKETRRFDIKKHPPKIFTALKNKPFRNFIIVNAFFGISMAALWPIYPVIQVKMLEMTIFQLMIASAVYAILFSIGNFIGGFVADRVGRKPVIIVSRIIMFSVSLLYIPAVLTGSWYFVLLTNAVSGIGNGAFLVLMNAYALDMSSKENLGSYSGLAQVTWGIATFIGSFAAGFIAQSLSDNFGQQNMVIWTTIAIAIMRVLASIGYFFIKESLTKKERVNGKFNPV